MPPSDTRSNFGFSETASKIRPNLAFVVLIFGALIAFEIFNYTTTDHALTDLLGDLSFAGFIPWSTVLAIAFCGIDFAGIARLFTPEQGASEPKEVWYLFGAWLLAATMNAILTWWGVSMAVVNHQVQSAAVVDQSTLTGVVPVFVAIMVWIIRILIIGALSLSLDRLLHPGAEQVTALQAAWNNSRQATSQRPVQPAQPAMRMPAGLTSSALSSRPAVNRSAASSPASRFSRASIPDDLEEEEVPEITSRSRPEPTYHTLSMSARPATSSDRARRDSVGVSRFRRS